MSELSDNTPAQKASGGLGPRLDTVRELTEILAPSAVGEQTSEELPITAETFRQLSARLGRLLGLAGMTDCARAVQTLDHAAEQLPSDESLRNIDAVLVYVRARLRDVALMESDEAAQGPGDAADTTPSTAGSDDTLVSPSPAISGDASRAGTTQANEGDDAAADAVDVSQYSVKTQAVIRKFTTAPLRQRTPGEVVHVKQRSARDDRDQIPEELRRECLSEATGDLADLRALIASFGKMPGHLDALRDMAQLGHKVKGTVSTYLFDRLAEILLGFEGVPRVLQPVAVSRSAACLSLLIRFADVIEAALHEAGEQGDASEERLREAQALVAEAQVLASAADAPGAGSGTGAQEGPPPAVIPVLDRSIAQPPGPHRGLVDEDVLRVEPRQLDHLMHQSDGLAMNRAMLAQTSEEIHRIQEDMDHVLTRLASLTAQLTDLHPFIRQVGEQVPAGTSGPRWLVRRETSGGTWDDLELDSYTIFDDSLRSLSEAVLDANTLSSSLQALIQRLTRNSDDQRTVLHNMQQTIIHLRLVNLKTLADRVMLAVHQAAATYGRQVEISIQGEETEIDRNISEALIASIMQLVRNAVAHGIELPEERVAQRKPAVGKVWLHASYSGNEVCIEVGDDGRGVNPHQLIAAAVAEGILDAKQADHLTREQALALMFEPNLSTMDQAGVIAGHGIGLDGVLTSVLRLRGSISVRSEPRQGSVFQIRVPISLSIMHALHVRVSGNEYAIPLASVRRMFEVPASGILDSMPDAEPETTITAARYPRRLRVSRSSPERPLRLAEDASAALYDEVPVFSLAELLNVTEDAPKTTHMALLIDAGQREVAVLVDKVLDESEIVIRALPAHLRRRAVLGASIRSDGGLFLVLDLADLLAGALGGMAAPRPQPAPATPQPRQRVPRVLVVDDSISMRRALEGALTSVGYEVRSARDGVEALGLMIADVPDIMVLDIEMPRLDGFELLSVIRGNEALARVPVVVLTSRAAEKHHRQAMELGVRAYLTKPCPDEILISHLQRVLRESQERP